VILQKGSVNVRERGGGERISHCIRKKRGTYCLQKNCVRYYSESTLIYLEERRFKLGEAFSKERGFNKVEFPRNAEEDGDKFALEVSTGNWILPTKGSAYTDLIERGGTLPILEGETFHLIQGRRTHYRSLLNLVGRRVSHMQEVRPLVSYLEKDEKGEGRSNMAERKALFGKKRTLD